MSDTILGIIIGGSFTLAGTLVSLFGNWIKEYYSIATKKVEQNFTINKELLDRKINALENSAIYHIELHSFCIGLNKIFTVLGEQNFEFDENQYNTFSANLQNSFSEVSKLSYRQSLPLFLYLDDEVENLLIGEQELEELLTSISLIHQLNQKFDNELSNHSKLLQTGNLEQAKLLLEQNDNTWKNLTTEVSRIIKILENVQKLTFNFIILLRKEIKSMKS